MDIVETLGLALAALIGTGLASVFGRSAWRGLRPGHWRPVAARVVRTSVETTAHDGGSRHGAHVHYAYHYDGVDHVGSGIVSPVGGSRRDAEETLLRYPVGHVLRVDVYVPDPREARLDRRESVMAVIGTLFGVGLVLFAVWMLAKDA